MSSLPHTAGIQAVMSVWADPTEQRGIGTTYPDAADHRSIRPSLHIGPVVVTANGGRQKDADAAAAEWWRVLASKCYEIAAWYDAHNRGGAR